MKAEQIAKLIRRYVKSLESKLYGRKCKVGYIMWLQSEIKKCQQAIDIMNSLE